MSDPASASSSGGEPAPVVPQVLYLACASSDVDAVTGQCSRPVWVAQQGGFPALDMVSASAIAAAILACWAVAYSIKVIRRAGD